VISIREVRERFAEPLLLVRGVRANHAALHDLLKQLVARFLERTRNHDLTMTLCFLLRHYWTEV